MANPIWKLLKSFESRKIFKPSTVTAFKNYRYLSSLPNVDILSSNDNIKDNLKRRKPLTPPHLKHVYPEFLPDPDVKRRNLVRERLERADMMSRRSQVDLPEFYVGSIISVISSDPHSQGKTSKFVGICIDKGGCGLRANFTLRNIVDHQGIEIWYDMYDPTIQKIQVLRLEKRLDDPLHYLRDADNVYSKFDFDMEPEIHLEGAEVPVNKMQIKLHPRPWRERWERQDLKGVVGIEEHLRPIDFVRMKKHAKPWEKYDLMKDYRSTIPEEEQSEIWADVYTQLHQLELMRKKTTRKRSFVLPKKA